MLHGLHVISSQESAVRAVFIAAELETGNARDAVHIVFPENLVKTDLVSYGIGTDRCVGVGEMSARRRQILDSVHIRSLRPFQPYEIVGGVVIQLGRRTCKRILEASFIAEPVREFHGYAGIGIDSQVRPVQGRVPVIGDREIVKSDSRYSFHG